jgi:hypothetical protein
LLLADENWDARVQGAAIEQAAEALPVGDTYQSAANAEKDINSRVEIFEIIALSNFLRLYS